jgi:hypothetical protein
MEAGMKYYCKNCGTDFDIKDKVWEDDTCPICGNDDPDYLMIPYPDYETLDQYKVRTGKELSDKAQVWYRYGSGHITGEGIFYDEFRYAFHLETYRTLKKLVEELKIEVPSGRYQILIGGPEPPPDDFISKTIDGVDTRVVLPRDWEVENECG